MSVKKYVWAIIMIAVVSVQTAAAAWTVSYRFTPVDVPARFGRPPSGNEAGAGIGPTIPQTPYFDGAQCLVELADGQTETLPLPPQQWGKDGGCRIIVPPLSVVTLVAEPVPSVDR